MTKEKIYVIQFGMGGTINLMPFGAGMLVSSLKRQQDILDRYVIEEIVFRREEEKEFVAQMENCSIIVFCCALWNLNLSLRTAREVRKKFPKALILFGGSAIPIVPALAEKFLREHPQIDLIGKGEGEELIVELCREYISGKSLENIQGIVWQDKNTGKIYHTSDRNIMALDLLPSPYLDGTFDNLLLKYKDEFSGTVMEFTRGCPFQCTFCTWGFPSNKTLREKPLKLIKEEIGWVGKNKINYLSLADSNFGLKKRDMEIAKMLAECKEKYNAPNYISLNWVKNSSPEVIQIAEILRKAHIGFRVTLSIESMNPDTLKAIKRYNISEKSFKKIKADYSKAGLYCYTELLLGLPLETYNSFRDGIEKNLGDTILEQIFIYLLYFVPNTELGSTLDREKYGLQNKVISTKYPKNKEIEEVEEYSEIVIATSTMTKEEWVDSFVESFYTLALHNERLAFFIFTYLKWEYDIRIVDLIKFVRDNCQQNNLMVINRSLEKLKRNAEAVQTYGESQFIKAEGYGEMLWEPSQAVFLELLSKKENFYPELMVLIEAYLTLQKKEYHQEQLVELVAFQEAVMAHPLGPKTSTITLQYDWVSYFQNSFGPAEKTPLGVKPQVLSIIDPKPSQKDYDAFIKNHFNIRGEPCFNELFDEDKNKIFPITTAVPS